MSNGRQQQADAAIETADEDLQPPLARLRHLMHVSVNFWIMSLFAFANAGVALSGNASGSSGTSLVSPVSIGVAFGLILGKPTGITIAVWMATRFGATLPTGATWPTVFGVACLAGIGFTMSLFISGLALPDAALLAQAKLGIVTASMVAGVVGASIICFNAAPTKTAPAASADEDLSSGERRRPRRLTASVRMPASHAAEASAKNFRFSSDIFRV